MIGSVPNPYLIGNYESLVNFKLLYPCIRCFGPNWKIFKDTSKRIVECSDLFTSLVQMSTLVLFGPIMKENWIILRAPFLKVFYTAYK